VEWVGSVMSVEEGVEDGAQHTAPCRELVPSAKGGGWRREAGLVVQQSGGPLVGQEALDPVADGFRKSGSLVTSLPRMTVLHMISKQA